MNNALRSKNKEKPHIINVSHVWLSLYYFGFILDNESFNEVVILAHLFVSLLIVFSISFI